MPAEWTGRVVGEMHVAGITAKQLAEEMKWHPKYLSAVLNGHKEPKGAEEAAVTALERLKAQQGA